MAFLERGDGKIYFHVEGVPPKQPVLKAKGKTKGKAGTSVPTLLMLRGLGRSSRYWLGFDKVMAKHFRVVTLDLRGVGRSTTSMHWTDTIDDLAEDCLAVMDHIDVERFHIFGLSYGGMLGAAIAAKAPERVDTLMIGASSSADYKALRVSATVLPKLLLALRAGRFQDALLSLCVPKHVLRSWGPEIQAAWQDILKTEGFPLLSTLKQFRAAMGFSIRGKLDHPIFPVLFLHGGMDAFVPLRNSRELNRLVSGSVLKIIPGAGHEITLGFEEEIAKILREFALGTPKAERA